MKQKRNLMINNQKGFTLIEIIAVLVILGLLAVVAVPKYTALQTKAAEKAAEGVWGAANSGASMNFANGLLEPTGHTVIADGTTLLATFESTPQGWAVNGGDTGITDGTYSITVNTAESIANKTRAILIKTGF